MGAEGKTDVRVGVYTSHAAIASIPAPARGWQARPLPGFGPMLCDCRPDVLTRPPAMLPGASEEELL